MIRSYTNSNINYPNKLLIIPMTTNQVRFTNLNLFKVFSKARNPLNAHTVND